MKQGSYPTAGAIAQTVRHESTSLNGVREFFASAGIVAYATERSGMANIAARTTLAPTTARRISTFLDMVTPAVGGLVMQPAGVQALQLEIGPMTACGRLREAADAKNQSPVGRQRVVLECLDVSSDERWEWMGILSYDHSFRLKSGQFTTSRPRVTFHVRSGPHPTQAQILVEIRHADDHDVVTGWMGALLPASERWSFLPFALLNDRHEEIRAVVAALGGTNARVANPQLQRRGTRTSAGEITEFTRNMQDARYTTLMQGLESLLDRADAVDDAILGAFDLYAWSGSTKSPVAARLRLKQLNRDPLTVTWGAAREQRTASGLPLASGVQLDADGWEAMTPVGWDEDRKMQHLRGVWHQILSSVATATARQAA
ncbi:hypothetical protein [Patulibacter sp. SYSU D01012]|uniref:hypothetical protein n=1 Tax=Patulibacter sp. SYSU D01012 TaxID=2817381 RepID=UPI001B310EF1|nr:hypothetical protein [Patulibacter sp. SYSU D01012]